MIRAYHKVYLEKARNNLGRMLDFATYDLGYDPCTFFDLFINSGLAKRFEKGEFNVTVGMSGVELAYRVLELTGHQVEDPQPRYSADRSPEYWAGWALAYLQWYTGYPFEKINGWGVTIPFLLSLYPTYHEADISRLTETAIKKMAEYRYKAVNPLKRQRRSAGLTQQELAEKSGVKLRMIQAYEQGYQDISKAEVQSVLKLARVLRCSPEDLLY